MYISFLDSCDLNFVKFSIQKSKYHHIKAIQHHHDHCTVIPKHPGGNTALYNIGSTNCKIKATVVYQCSIRYEE